MLRHCSRWSAANALLAGPLHGLCRLLPRSSRLQSLSGGLAGKYMFLMYAEHLLSHRPPARLVEAAVGGIGGELAHQEGVGSLQAVIGHGGKQVMQSVVADGERKEEPRQPVAAGVVAGVADVVGELQVAAVRLEVMIGQLPQLVHEQHGEAENIKLRQA